METSNTTITSEQLKLALEKAKADSVYGKELQKRLESGKYDTQLSEIGVKRTPTGLQRVETRGQELGADIKQIGTDIGSDLKQGRADAAKTIEAYKSGEQGLGQTAIQAVKQSAGFATSVFGDALKGIVRSVLSQADETAVKEGVGKIASSAMDTMSKYEELQKTNPTKAKVVNLALAGIPNASLTVKDILDGYEKLKTTNPVLADSIGATLNVISLASDVVGLGEVSSLAKTGVKTAGGIASDVAKGVAKSASGVGNVTSDLVSGVSDVASNVKASGVGQIVSDLAERVPRAIERGKEKLAEASVRAEKIKSSTPAVQNAIKSNLDERIINTVNQADDATKRAYRDVLDIAEESPKTIGTKKQPTVVGGELASQQFDLINKQKKLVGSQIGEETKKLSKTTKVAMKDGFNSMDDYLVNEGVVPRYTDKGIELDFTGSRFTPAERKKIQELYNLATEGGDTLSPLQIRQKDQLFSKLKREANFEGIGNIIVETKQGNRSLFDVFRDIYSSQLDSVSPLLKKLNTQYRNLARLTDDIEDSIFKTPNFNVTKSVDPAEFAKVNLRRIFGEAQSSPVFEAVADMMDSVSRKLGYKGATPKNVAEFAQELRKLFPETTPKTGFSGGIKAGLSDIIETVSKAGAPNLKDQQKALRELLESYLTKTKNSITPSTTPKTPMSFASTQTKKTVSPKASKSGISRTVPKTVKKSSMAQSKASGQSFDEWVNSRDIVYHGSSADNITNIEKNGFKNVPTTFFAKDEGAAHIFGGGEIKGNNTKTIAVDVTDAKPTIDATGNVVVSAENLKNIKTRSQLKAEWDKIK